MVEDRSAGLQAWRKMVEALIGRSPTRNYATLDDYNTIEAALLAYSRSAEREAALVATAYQLAAKVCTDASDAYANSIDFRGEVCSMCHGSGKVEQTSKNASWAGDDRWEEPCSEKVHTLILADARAALGAVLEKAREEGRCEEAFTVEKTSAKFALAVERARKEERDACATLCEEWAASNHEAFTEQALAAQTCSRHIRARGTKLDGTASE